MRVAAVYMLFADTNGAESVQWGQYIDQHIDKDSRRVDPQELPRTDLEHQAVFDAAQLGIASRVKRREKSVTSFRVVTPAPTRTSTGLDEHAEKLFDNITSKMSLKARLIQCWRKHVTTGKEQLMSEHPPTLLIVYLRPEHVEGARYHIDEALTTAGITYRLIAEHEERVSLESAAPFVITHIEKRMVFALRASLAPKVIDDMALLVTTGLILGFAVKGEIALDDEMGVINNLVA